VAEAAQPLEERTAGVQRATKRLLAAARDFNKEIAKWRDELAQYGIVLEIVPNPAQPEEAQQ
jgi:hypothetical protein